jgi:hypothetical protein
MALEPAERRARIDDETSYKDVLIKELVKLFCRDKILG